jgi:integrase
VALTDTAIRALKPREKPYQAADGGGLVVEVMPGGAKVWRLRYRLAGKAQKVTIGHYPAVALAKARLERERLKVALAEGRSPAREKQEAKRLAVELAHADNTVEAFARFWFSEVAEKANQDPRNIRRYLEKDVIPRLGAKQLADVTPTDVLDLCDRIKKRGADQSALQVRNILKRIYSYAIARQRVQFNPAAAIQAQYIATAKSRERALTKEEIGRLLRSVYSSNMRRAHKLALHLLLLTMVRKADLIDARWEHIDPQAGEWHIPQTKTGKPHVVYLSRQARELFADLRELAGGSPYVLPSRASLQRPIAHSTLNVAIRALGIEIADFVLHDFRRTASTHLHEAGFPADVVEKALAHTINGVRGIYNRAEYADQRRAMLQQWADMVDSWLNAKGAEVVTLGIARAA